MDKIVTLYIYICIIKTIKYSSIFQNIIIYAISLTKITEINIQMYIET